MKRRGRPGRPARGRALRAKFQRERSPGGDAAPGEGIVQGNLLRRQLLFFLPILAGSFFQQLYTTVDAVVVGQFAGKEGLAAIDATGSLIRLFTNLFIGVSTGATILIAQQLGARASARTGASAADTLVFQTTHTAIALAAAGGAMLTLLGVTLAAQGVRLMQVPGDITGQATVYIRVYCLGMLPSMLYNMAAGILRAAGDSRTPVLALLAGGGVNVVLDLLLVGALGQGVAGAAGATVVAQAVSMAWVLASLVRSGRLKPAKVRFVRGITGQILQKGLPVGLQSAMYPVSNMVIHARVNRLGTDTVAAWAVCGKLDLPIWLVMDALAITISTFAAQNYGAGKPARVRASVRVCTGIALCTIAPISLALLLFARPLGGLFVRDAQVIAISVALLRFYAPFFICYIPGEVLSGAIRGSGQTLYPMLITLGCTCLLRIVWIVWLIPADATAAQVIAAYPITWFLTSLAFWGYWAYFRRRRLSEAAA